MPDNIENIRRIASFLWEAAQDLHGAVTKSENQNILLPLTVLRRLDYAFAPTKEKVLNHADAPNKLHSAIKDQKSSIVNQRRQDSTLHKMPRTWLHPAI